MADDRIAVIAGATGLVGGHALRLLLEEPGVVQVVALLRRPLPDAHPRLTQRVVDLHALPDDAFEGATDVYCALGTTLKKAGSREAFRRVDHEAVLAVAEHAARAGARRFALVSSVGADPASSNFYLRVKGEAERDVAALPFEGVHFFRPSFLLGDRGERRPGEALGIALARGVQGAMVGGLKKYRPVEATAVAAAMLAAARRGEPGRHVYHYDEIQRLAGSG